ncbi:hypothetical protein RchiOBHm_Chr7g0217261 [Rosa chinensis]|uniref:Uncharacterized protein n=1 Tax=Rosa chinensis TaxID=74649 RepID=A0A2P6PC01_ROSCH|nr:hypothetical protein RchiOBHm_Chr7g0217261 [Rosa chinensis]
MHLDDSERDFCCVNNFEIFLLGLNKRKQSLPLSLLSTLDTLSIRKEISVLSHTPPPPFFADIPIQIPISPPPCSQISSSSPSNYGQLKRCKRLTDSSSSLSRNSNRLTSPWPPTGLPYLLRRSEEGPCPLSKPESPLLPLWPPKSPSSPSDINIQIPFPQSKIFLYFQV